MATGADERWAFCGGWMMSLCAVWMCATAYSWPPGPVQQLAVLSAVSIVVIAMRAVSGVRAAEDQHAHAIKAMSAKLSEPIGDAMQLVADVNALAMRAERWADEHGIGSSQIDAAIAAQRTKTYLQHAARAAEACAELASAARKAS
jgi:hypothetical protein